MTFHTQLPNILTSHLLNGILAPITLLTLAYVDSIRMHKNINKQKHPFSFITHSFFHSTTYYTHYLLTALLLSIFLSTESPHSLHQTNMSIVSLFTKLFKRIGKVFEHTSSSPIPPSSCFPSSSTNSHSVSSPTISNSILPLNIKTTLPTLSTIVADVEKMKKDVSVNVVLDLGSNEQVSAASVYFYLYELTPCVGCQGGREGKFNCLPSSERA